MTAKLSYDLTECFTADRIKGFGQFIKRRVEISVLFLAFLLALTPCSSDAMDERSRPCERSP